MENGKTTHKITDIIRKHNTNLKLSTTAILTTSDTQWQVQSSISTAIYTVSLDDQQCQCSL